MKIAEAQELAELAMIENGLDLTGWEFRFDKAVRRFGACHHHRRLITLSKTLTELNSEEEVRDTVLHEIAHALAGSRAGHGRAWKQWAQKIGARPERTYSSANVTTPPPKFIGRCINGHTTTGNKRRSSACAKCCNEHNGGQYTDDFKWEWSTRDGQMEG